MESNAGYRAGVIPRRRMAIWRPWKIARARSSSIGCASAIVGEAFSAAQMESAGAKTFPSMGTAARGGSRRDTRCSIRERKPLNTLMTTTMAAMAKAMPAIDTIEMVLTTEWLFFADRYRRAMRRESKGEESDVEESVDIL